MEHPETEQIERSSAVHFALEQLEPRNLPLDLSLALGQAEGCCDGWSVSP